MPNGITEQRLDQYEARVKHLVESVERMVRSLEALRSEHDFGPIVKEKIDKLINKAKEALED